MVRPRVFRAGSDAPEEISGADVVVVSENDSAEWAERLRVRAPNSVVVVVGESVQAFCEGTLFPRARIIGVGDQSAADEVVEAIVHDLDKEIEAVVRCEGERGIEGEFSKVPVRVGARGIREIVED